MPGGSPGRRLRRLRLRARRSRRAHARGRYPPQPDPSPGAEPMTVKTPIYLDHAATCPVDRRVVDKMMPYFTDAFGNAASRTHSFGWHAEEAVENAREEIAKTINADPKEIAWTSGATESDNLAIKGVAEYLEEQGNHIITVVTEHKAVIDTCKYLERHGREITFLPVDKNGLVTPEQVAAAITDKTVLVSIMHANNE